MKIDLRKILSRNNNLTLEQIFKMNISSPKFKELFLEKYKSDSTEVINYINSHYRMMCNIKSEEMNKAIDFFRQKYSIEEILSFEFFNNITKEMCDEYLSNNFDWINNDKITSKLDSGVLFYVTMKYNLLGKKEYRKKLFSLLDTFEINEFLNYNRNNLFNILDLINYISDDKFKFLERDIVTILQSNIDFVLDNVSKELFNKLITNGIVDILVKENNDIVKKIIIKNPYNIINDINEDKLVSYLSRLEKKDIAYLLTNQNTLYDRLKNSSKFDINEFIFNSDKSLIRSSHLVRDYYFKYDFNTLKEYILENDSILPELLEKEEFVLKVRNDLLFFIIDEKLLIKLLPYIKKLKLIDNIDSLSEFTDLFNHYPLLEEYYIKNLDLFVETIFNFKFDSFSKLEFLFKDHYINKIPLDNMAISNLVLSLSTFNEFSNLFKESSEFQDFIRKNPEALINRIKVINDEMMLSHVYMFLEENAEFFEYIEKDKDCLDKLTFNINDNLFMKYLDQNPKVEQKIFTNKYILEKILNNEDYTFRYLFILNKLNIETELTKKYNKKIEELQKERPEFSLGNTSLKKEMLNDDFIEDLGFNYINAILEYDTTASDKAVELYKRGELLNLKLFLDYLSINISNNRRMIHYYIMEYDNIKDLLNNIIINNISLNDNQKQILKEIICQGNIYNIKNITDLENYQFIKYDKLKDNINEKNIKELFLNESSLINGVPWNLHFKLESIFGNKSDTEYFKYKYVDTKIISKEDFNYLKDVNDLIDKVYKKDINIKMEIESLLLKYKGNYIPTARKIKEAIIKENNKNFNEQLMDLEEVRKVASYDNPNAAVYITFEDGIEKIYLNNYDFRCMCHFISNSREQNSTFSHTFRGNFEQYIIFSENVKYKLKRKSLSGISIGNLLRQKPKLWNEVEGISTISTGVSSNKHYYHGLGFGKQSNISVIGESGGDAMVSHNLRNIVPNYYDGTNNNFSTIYGSARGEIWFDRKDSNIKTNNQRIQPEFVIGNEIYLENYAKELGCPMIIPKENNNLEEYSNYIDKKDRENYSKTLNKKFLYNIIYNKYNSNEEEKVNFIISCIMNLYKNKQIDLDLFSKKMLEVKWLLYENYKRDYLFKIDTLLDEYCYQEQLKKAI